MLLTALFIFQPYKSASELKKAYIFTHLPTYDWAYFINPDRSVISLIQKFCRGQQNGRKFFEITSMINYSVQIWLKRTLLNSFDIVNIFHNLFVSLGTTFLSIATEKRLTP